MPSDRLLVFAILGIAVLLFASDKLRLDLVALLALLALSLLGILTPTEALAGFADPLVIMIAALFVVGGAVFRSGLAERLGRILGRIAGTGRARVTAVVMIGTGFLSAFISTTGTVALMIPVTTSLARNARMSPSLLLMPMAIGAILGGLLTLIATPPNIIVSNQLRAAGYEPFGFFDFTPIGLVMLGAGVAALLLFGRWLLPARTPVDRPAGMDGVAVMSGNDISSGYAVGHVVRLRVAKESALVGVSPAAATLRQRYRVNVLAIRRPHGLSGRRERVPRTAEEPLRVDDEIDVRGEPDAVHQLLVGEGLVMVSDRTDPHAELAEVLLTPRSRLVGQTLVDAKFRSRYGVNVLALRRQGVPVDGDIATIPLRFADTLLVAGSPHRIDLLRGEGGDFVVVARAKSLEKPGGLSRAEMLAIAIVAGMLVILTFELLPPAIAILLAAACMVLAGSIDMASAYDEINWQSVILIAAILPMATALQKTGGMDLIVGQLRPFSEAGPLAMMAAIFVLTGLTGLFISNTATAALIAPIALGAAQQLGISPHPLLMTVAIASTTAFATPVATPANMLILGPGDYRFMDYVRVGVPLQAVFLILTLLIVPFLFPF